MDVFTQACDSLIHNERHIKHEATERIRESAKNHQEMAVTLHQVAMAFLRYGIVDLDNRGWIDAKIHGVGWGRKGFRWEAFIRSLAKEHNRPAVYKLHNRYCLPKRVAFHKVVGALHLAPSTVVQVHSNTVQWFVMFQKVPGWGTSDPTPDQVAAAEIETHWLQQFQSNRDFRKALRLP
jgi:hypothetical protein